MIFYQQNRNLFQLNVKDFAIKQLTNFKNGNESTKKTKVDNYLEKQQKELFQFVRDTKAKQDWYDKKYENSKIKGL